MALLYIKEKGEREICCWGVGDWKTVCPASMPWDSIMLVVRVSFNLNTVRFLPITLPNPKKVVNRPMVLELLNRRTIPVKDADVRDARQIEKSITLT